MKHTFFENIDLYLFYVYVLILPIFPYSQIFFSVSVLLLMFLIKAVKIIFTKKISFSTGPFDIPVIVILLTYLASSLFISPSKMDTIIYPGTTTIIFVAVILYFLTNQLNLSSKKVLKYFLFAGVVLYSIMILLISIKVVPWFSPIDNYLLPTLYISALIPIMINVFSIEKEFVYRFLIAVASLISIFAMSVAIFLSPKPKFLPFDVSTIVITNSLKQNLFLGIGPGNFLNAFNKYRPFEYNQLETWSTKFNQGSSFLVTNLTETGIFGSMAFLALIAIFINYAINTTISRKKVGWGLLGSTDLLTILVITASLAVFQSSPILIFTLFIMLAVVSEPKKHDHLMPSKIVSSIVAIPIIILIGLISYKAYIVSRAEFYFSSGLKNLSENKAKDSYDDLNKAISLNSKVDRYHKAMSSVNFGIAKAISQKQNLNDSEKEQATIFIQKSIDEAKAAVALNNQSSENWEFLGKTYHLLIPFTTGADLFAIESYKEAIALDPINPNLRIRLGEIYMIQKKYSDAIEAFNLAILAKDNHPNSHFNLALAYKENNEIVKAKNELNRTLELIEDKNGKDYEMVKKEIDSINNPRPTTTTIETSETEESSLTKIGN